MQHKTYPELLSELEKAQKLVKVDGLYSHFKHPENSYKVIGFTFIESSDETGVLYTPENQPSICFTRPLSSWMEEIVKDGKTIKRFQLLN